MHDGSLSSTAKAQAQAQSVPNRGRESKERVSHGDFGGDRHNQPARRLILGVELPASSTGTKAESAGNACPQPGPSLWVKGPPSKPRTLREAMKASFAASFLCSRQQGRHSPPSSADTVWQCGQGRQSSLPSGEGPLGLKLHHS